MHPVDLNALVVRVQAADAEGLSILIAGTRGQVRTLAARYAASLTMLDEVFRDSWAWGYRGIATCAPGAFDGWIAAQVKAQLERLLRDGERKAAATKDALGHVLLRSALDALAGGAVDPVAEEQRLRAAVDGLDAKSRQIIGGRYGERASIDTVAKLVGETPAKTGSLLFRARAALGGVADLGNQLAVADTLFPGLVEDCINGLIVPDARELLAGSVLKDLRYAAVFEAQVRNDLLLRAVYEPTDMEAARVLAYALAKPAANATRESDRRKPVRASEPRSRAIGAASERQPIPVRAVPAGGPPWLWIGVGLMLVAIVIGAIAMTRQPPPRSVPQAAVPPVETAKPPVPAPPAPAVETAGQASHQPSVPANAGNGIAAPAPTPVAAVTVPVKAAEKPKPPPALAVAGTGPSAVATAAPAAVTAVGVKREVILWDGDSESAGGGWNGPGNTQLKAQSIQVHQGTKALHAHTSGMDFATFGWNWRSWQPNKPKDDATPFAYLLIAIKVDGPAPASGLHLYLRCPLADDIHKSAASNDIDVLKYCPNALDGEWHEVAILLKDVTGKDAGFDLHRLWEVAVRIWTKGPLDCNVYLDDIGYGGRL